MELRGFSDEHGVQVASWAMNAGEVALLSGRVEYPFPEDLRTSWRTVEEDIHSYLLFDGERPVGYGEVWLDDEEDEVELARIIVDPALRGRGVGGELVRALLGPALDAGYSEVFIRVRPENAAAVRAYHGSGFVDVPAALMEEWNDGQPVPYRWMRYVGEQVDAGELRG
ncbi:GNAT family N-acetyltransferase [Kribbella sp. NPDC051586]|uniref:GNAT family N-acetyltransferase n=1 Tax=Kribbella sp. NPDC051586 TaxID=3364118 RepID=UPI00378A4C67